MIRLLLIASTVLSLASAFLAFQTKVRGGQLTEDRETAEKKAQTSQEQLNKEKKQKKDLEEKLAKAEKEGGELKTSAEKAKTDLTQAKDESTKLAESLKEKDSELRKAKEEMSKPKTEDLKAATAESEAKIADLRGQLEKAQQAAQQQETRAEDLVKQIAEMKRKKEEAVQKAIIAKKEAIKSTVGRVVAYNPDWNFIVVNIGDKNGVTSASNLEVQRSGKTVAKLQVTRVQPEETTAGLIALNGAKFVKIEPSDVVVFADGVVSSSASVSTTLDTAKVP